MRSTLAIAMAAILSSLVFAQPAKAVDRQSAVQYNLPGKPPYLVAHYMMWYSTPWTVVSGNGIDGTAENWTHWKWMGGKTPHDPVNKLPDGHRDIASVLYPLIGIYDSGSRAVIHYHLAVAKASGVSAIDAIWYGPGSDTDKRFSLLLDEAAKLQMRVWICYEEKLNFPKYRQPKNRDDLVKSATEDMTYILQHYADHPAYLRRNGIPVIQQFNGYGNDPELGSHQLSPDEWRKVFAAAPGKIEYIRQNLDAKYHPPIAAAYVWWDQSDWPRRFAKDAAALRKEGRLDFFMGMVCPGFNDTGVWGWGAGPRVSKGYGLDVLKSTTDQALNENPECVQLVTWNDFNESTCFEPTVQHGYQFLDALEQWWGQKTGRPVNAAEKRAAFEEYRHDCSAQERAEIPDTSGIR